MTDKERQIIESQLAEIDVRRSQLEAMLSTMPHSPHCCDDCERAELEIELRDLWAYRVEISRQLGPSRLSRN